jgi:hypothetical protein
MALEVLRESLRRGRVPVVVPGVVADDGLHLSLHAAMDAMMTLPDEIARLRERAEEEMSVRYGSDAGWNQVWSAISVSKVLG